MNVRISASTVFGAILIAALAASYFAVCLALVGVIHPALISTAAMGGALASWLASMAYFVLADLELRKQHH